MAESISVADSLPVSGADLKRAEKFAREPFVLEGEDAASAVSYTHLTLPTTPYV